VAKRSSSPGEAPRRAWGDALRAARVRRDRLRLRAVGLALGAVLLGATIIAPPVPRLVWNASASAPLGLYLITPDAQIESGDMVVARLPLRTRDLADGRHYLPINVPLVKRVAAIAGDEVCALGTSIYRDGRWIAVRKMVDGKGRTMPRWQGCHILRGGQVLLLMDAPDSFDGRYFGITDPADIIGKAQQLWAR
jgi:conjugative transfer signal peptidase TraF